MPRLAVHVCGLPPPADGRWHPCSYLEAKCGTCKYAARYVRQRPGKRAEYRCGTCKERADG